jgi:Transposase Tn5 dimerisation domain
VTQPPAPKLNKALHLIARLGSFLGRKGDGEPGVKTIWLGLKEVHVAASTLRGLRPPTATTLFVYNECVEWRQVPHRLRRRVDNIDVEVLIARVAGT